MSHLRVIISVVNQPCTDGPPMERSKPINSISGFFEYFFESFSSKKPAKNGNKLNYIIYIQELLTKITYFSNNLKINY